MHIRTEMDYLPIHNYEKSHERLTKGELFMIKLINFVFTFCVILIGACLLLQGDMYKKFNDNKKQPLNVIFMISDGFGPTSETFGRTYYQYVNKYSYKNITPLDKMLVGQSRTRSNSSLITDSAAGATAFSCGLKTYNYGVAVDPEKRPCATLLEGAHEKGMLTGVVVTSRITHATPAAFIGHAIDRNDEDFIATWLTPNITNSKYERHADLLFGGGLCHFIPSHEPNSCRKDDLNLIENSDFTFIKDRESFDNLKDNAELPLLGLFTPDHMSFEIDRNPKKEPALWEMTDKALKILSNSDKKGKGFFMLIEGSRIDMAAHGNDPAAHANDILAYYKTIEVVQKFVDEHPNTLVVSVSDHETGGLALGYQPTKVYPKYVWYPDVISRVKKSTNKIALEIEQILKTKKNSSDEDDSDDDTLYNLTSNIISKRMGIDDITEEELNYIVESPANRKTVELANYLAKMVSDRAKIAWTTHGHSGADVNLYAYGKNAKLFRGSKENIEIGRIVEKLLDIDLDKLTKHLFSDYKFPTNDIENNSKPKFKEMHYHHRDNDEN